MVIGQKILIRSLHQTNINPLDTPAPAEPPVLLGYPAMLVLLFVVLVNFGGIGALFPVLPYTVIEWLELSAKTMTSLFASVAFTMLLLGLFLGCLSDNVGTATDFDS